MKQIIEESFDTIKEAREFCNQVSIEYDYVEDINISFNQNQYIAIIKFDIDCKYEVLGTFDLAKLKEHKSIKKGRYIWVAYHQIKFLDKRLKDGESFKCIKSYIRKHGKGEKDGFEYTLHISFDLKDWTDVIEIIYKGFSGYEVVLRNFELNSSWGVLSKEQEHFIVKKIDKDILYEHIVEVYKQRGYLFDLFSLKVFKELAEGIERGVNSGLILEEAKKERKEKLEKQ